MNGLSFDSVVINFNSDLNSCFYVRGKTATALEIIITGPILRKAALCKSEYVKLLGPLHTEDVDQFTVTTGPSYDEIIPGNWKTGEIEVKTRDLQKAIVVSLAMEVSAAADEAMDLANSDYEQYFNTLSDALTLLKAIDGKH